MESVNPNSDLKIPDPSSFWFFGRRYCSEDFGAPGWSTRLEHYNTFFCPANVAHIELVAQVKASDKDRHDPN
eukprot:scaffold419_cov147-Skeletonema_menzelii.AAC.13